MAEQQETELVPCSKCGAPVLPNLAECMFCGQTDPGKLASSNVGRKYVETKQQIRRSVRQASTTRSRTPSATLPDKLGQYRYLFEGDFAVTHTLIVTYIVLYLFSLLIDLGGVRWFSGLFNIISPSGNALLSLGATGRGPVMIGRVWTVLTAHYLHTSLIDVAIGCLFLFQIGRMTERFFGSAPFFLVYAASGIAGGVVATLAGATLITTPRAALFGLFAAIIAYTRNQHDPVSQQIMRQMGMFALVLLLFDLLGSVTLLMADLGGAAAGFGVATLLLSNPSFRYDPLADRIARLLALVTAISLAVSLVVGLFL